MQKRKVVKKEKWKGMCVEEKKQREKRGKKKRKRNAVRVWRIKKGKKKKEKEIVSQYFHNIFTTNFKW